MMSRASRPRASLPAEGGPVARAPALSLGRSAFAVAVLVAVALPPEACTLVYAALVVPLLLRRGLVGWRVLARLITPLVGLLLIGVCLDYAHLDWWAFAQDLWRILKPILLLVLGYTAVRSSWRGQPFPADLVLIGLLYACVYLVRLAVASAAAGVGPLELSDTLVVGHFPEALTLGICLRHRELGPGRARPGWLLRRAAFALAGLALLLSGSRTWILAAVVMLLAGTGWMRARARWRGAVFVLVLAVAILATPFGATLFTKGFDVAVAEISPAHYTVLGDIHENWRGFESWQALHAFSQGTPLQQVLGQGFGAKADLGLYIELAGVDFKEIGQFHNGLVWVLLKTGYLGMLVFGLWFWRLFLLCRLLAVQGKRAAADLCLGVVLILCLSTLVVSGIFNALSNDPIVMMLGGFLALSAGTRPALREQGVAARTVPVGERNE